MRGPTIVLSAISGGAESVPVIAKATLQRRYCQSNAVLAGTICEERAKKSQRECRL
jgi:hypothetical protein